MSRPLVRIVTGAACSPRSGVGGWAAVLASEENCGHPVEMCGTQPDSALERMELTAVVEPLEVLPCACEVELTTGSEYLRKAFTEGRLEPWPEDPWRSRGGDLTNIDLWRLLLPYVRIHDVNWKWLEGHSDDESHRRCDQLAVEAIEQLAVT